MDRSGRRTTVVVWAITAGVAFGGVVTSAAPAVADDRGSEPSGSDVASSDARGADAAPRHRTPSRTEARTTLPDAGPAPPPTPGHRGPMSATPGSSPVDPCVWLICPALMPPLPAGNNSPGGIVIGLPPSMPSVTPVPIFGDRRVVLNGLPDGEISLNFAPPEPPESTPGGGPVSGSGPGAQVPPPPSALVAPSPVVPPAVPVVAAPPAGPPARNVPDLPAPGLIGPIPAAPAARPAAPKLPEPSVALPELGRDDLGQIASSAAPGLAALVGMTLLGGVIGFRQARAGYLLRAAGAGRFLQ